MRVPWHIFFFCDFNAEAIKKSAGTHRLSYVFEIKNKKKSLYNGNFQLLHPVKWSLNNWKGKKLTLRHWGDVMLLRLSPTLVRPLGHAVHRAPDAECHQHPGYGTAGHAVFKVKLPLHGAYDHRCCVREVLFDQARRDLSSRAKWSLVTRSVPPPAIDPLLCSLRPQCAGYPAVWEWFIWAWLSVSRRREVQEAD